MGIKLSRRGWNNVIIVAVVIFIAMVQIPELMKARHDATPSSSPAVQPLLPEQSVISRLVLPRYELALQGSQWQATPAMEGSAQSLVEHWQSIAGTIVDEQMMAKLKPQLGAPRTVEVWLQSAQEPVRVTVYQLPQFWLLRSWQGAWLAVSVEESYLFPSELK